MYICPVCAYPQLRKPPLEYSICPSCGTEFDYHDSVRSHDQLRREWVNSGARWHSKVIESPPQWNPWLQLLNGNYPDYLPQWADEITTSLNMKVNEDGINFGHNKWIVEAV